jgi:hypothetical protein
MLESGLSESLLLDKGRFGIVGKIRDPLGFLAKLIDRVPKLVINFRPKFPGLIHPIGAAIWIPLPRVLVFVVSSGLVLLSDIDPFVFIGPEHIVDGFAPFKIAIELLSALSIRPDLFDHLVVILDVAGLKLFDALLALGQDMPCIGTI